MRLFISAGEPSGDLHGANLIRILRQMQPGIDFHGFGGDRMIEAGCQLAYPLCDMAMVGFVKVLGSVPKFARILNLAEDCFREQRPDAVVMIDFPGFHWWLARRAKAFNIPVIYFVPPQLWAWGSYRVGKMRRLVDQVLCTLPFEAEWYRARKVPSRYIGHPYFDELRQQRLDSGFMADQGGRPGPIVTLLPGSRNQELHHNLKPLIDAAAQIHARRPDTRFLVACLKDQHRLQVEQQFAGKGLPIEAHVGRTPECIQLAHSCLSVSGSVSLELLYRGKPSAVVYHHHWFGIALARLLMQCRYICLVNLLADKLLFPEVIASRSQAGWLAGQVLNWLENPGEYARLCGELTELRNRVAEPGACERAAQAILELVEKRRQSVAA